MLIGVEWITYECHFNIVAKTHRRLYRITMDWYNKC